MVGKPWTPGDDPPDPVSPAPLRDALLELAAEESSDQQALLDALKAVAVAATQLADAANGIRRTETRMHARKLRLGRLSVVYGTVKPERRQMQPLTDRIERQKTA